MCLSIMEKIVVVQLSSYRFSTIIMNSLWYVSLFGMKETDQLTGGFRYVFGGIMWFSGGLGFPPV